MEVLYSVSSVGFNVGTVAWLFVCMIVVGGSTGMLLGNGGIDVELHESYFVVAHFHVVLSLGAGMSVLLLLLLIVCTYVV